MSANENLEKLKIKLPEAKAPVGNYVAIKISTGDAKAISSGAWFLTLVFLSKFIFLA